MATKKDFHELLCELLGSRNVYNNPPTNTRMNYDAIRYKKRKPDVKYADDKKYKQMNCYEVIVIARKPDHVVINKLLDLTYSSWETNYVSDNLHHDVLTIYY